jgi:phosphopantothenoylcysteine synthetase/decarboxylase
MAERPKNILIGVTGSVATIKLPNIIHELKMKDPSVNVSLIRPNIFSITLCSLLLSFR